MKFYTAKLSEQSLKSLHEFLRRVDLKGSEVPTFNGLMTEVSMFRVVQDPPKVSPKASQQETPEISAESDRIP